MPGPAARRIPHLTIAVALLSALVGCRAAFRYPVEPRDAAVSADTALEAGMNPYLLTNVLTDRLVIEVDWVEGGRPHDDALDGLRRTLARHLPAGKTLEIVLDDEIPRAEWDAGQGSFLDRQDVLTPYLDHVPPPAGTDVVWLVVVPGEERFLGWTTEIVVGPDPESGGEPQPVDTVFLFAESIERESALWITPRKIEQAILVHELGHVLGLVSGQDHIEKDNPRHCTEPGCVMAHHRARSQLYNAPAAMIGKIPDDYGNKCRHDIARAKELWAKTAETELAEALTRRREARALRAQACWYAEAGQWLEAADRWRRARALVGEGSEGVEGAATQLERLCSAPPTLD